MKKETKSSITLVCKNCNALFNTWPSQIKYRNPSYCSRLCYYEYRKTEKICPVCNKLFYTGRVHRYTVIYCSIKCKNLDTKKISFTCKFCKKFFLDFPSRKRQFCSKQCFDNSRKLDDNKHYSAEFRKIRILILKESNKKCLICDNFANNIHHIDYNKKNNSYYNLVNLCSSCHGKTNFDRDFWEMRINWIIGCT